MKVLRGRFPLALVANADHGFLIDCLKNNGFEFDVVLDSQGMHCYKPERCSKGRYASRLDQSCGDDMALRHGGPRRRHHDLSELPVLLGCSC